MKLKQSLIIAITITLIATIGWEMYWRSKGFHPTLNDEKALWAMTRAKVENATKDDVIILGSSRAYFDIQVDQWKESTGKEPLQLASTGSSPLPTFHDIVNNTDFDGTVIVGVTPGLFFSTTFPKAFPWERPQAKVDHYFDGTYAQRSNFLLSVPLQQSLVLMSADEEEWNDDLDLKSLLRNVRWGKRTSPPAQPPFYNFGDVSIPRNMSMMPRTVTDTAFANSIIKVWHFFGKGSPPPEKDATTEFFMKDVKKFKERNGNLILVRPPSSGGVRMGEKMGLPRERFWDSLVKVAHVKSYHFEDFDQLKNLTCPEESHLSLEDANFYTKELVKILKEDNALTNQKPN
ncbi:hypothetical protein KFZ70_10950 [Tamlana fucoidanivorans]|uniref:Uncharacterized protein n=1 Tax=Allotamlana fucoidanivorans TaxID=2583814 RepID=A0A5C4SI27_9FLAO|nr:hypothetical protein [Tamlana fucoidanivorans]TNJ43203.1 hypothetical protein FGF67_12685 [Tamlana fucoidanivorans]